MIKLTNILRENVEQHKRRVYLKAAIEMAKSYSSRGYTPDEAVNDAARGIKNVYGYELTDKDKEAVKHFVPVNAQFKEVKWTSTSTDPSLTDRKPNPNVTDDDLAPAPESRPQWPKTKKPTKTGADRTPRSTKFYVNSKVQEKNGDEDYGIIKAVKNNWEAVKANPFKKEYIGMGTFLTDKNKNEPWYLIQFLNPAPFPDEFKSDPYKKDYYDRFLANRGIYFDPKNPYKGTPIWYPEEKLNAVINKNNIVNPKSFKNIPTEWGLKEDN